MFWTSTLPAINACFNATSFVLLCLGLWEIRHKRWRRHMRFMLAALVSSTLFLVGYLTRLSVAGTHRIAAAGFFKTAYLTLLFSHMVLAVLLLPLIGRALFLAWRRRFPEHRKIARWAWPTWVYVSVTGVIVYVMLYQVA